MTEPLISTLVDGVLHIEFNRPEKKNALTMQMYTLAAQAIEDAQTNPKVRALLFSGRGDSFTAGNDLGDFLNASQTGMATGLLKFLQLVPLFNKPIIAAIQGHAVGIGTTLLLHCDFVYANTDAKLQTPFVKLGLCPEFGSSLLLPQLIGQRRAAELLLLCKAIDANTAKDYGLINEVGDNYLEMAHKQALMLAAQPANAVRISKQLMKSANKDELVKVIEEERQLFAQQLVSPEAKEAMTAFFEKRAPDFSQFD